MSKVNIREKLAQMKVHAQIIIDLVEDVEKTLDPAPPKKRKGGLTKIEKARMIARLRKGMAK